MATAIVIGASMGGLLAARALADTFDQVTLVERDVFPAPGENRKGVPQGRHVHALLAGGREVLEDFFPGFTQQVVEKGAIAGDVAEFGLWYNGGGYHCRHNAGLDAVLISRPLLEAMVRMRLLELPNIRIIENCDVLGLESSTDRRQIVGVRIIRKPAHSAEEVLRSDLVIDAGGRGSRSPAWLEDLGYSRPEEEQVRVGISYTTRIYQRDLKAWGGINAVVVTASPENPRSGVMSGMEGDRWIISLSGYFGDQAPADEEGFMAFARSLPAPEIYETIRNSEPLSDFIQFKYPSNQRRRYERLDRFPSGYLVFGDAICSFNPIYGQGMSAAALEAKALQHCLKQGQKDLAKRFFKAASRVVDIPWSIALGNDLQMPQVDAPQSLAVRMVNAYLQKLHAAAHIDPQVSRAFLRVANLIDSPPSLMRPAIALRVLSGNFHRNKARKYRSFVQQLDARPMGN